MHVILVHGTFARRAAWLAPESPIRLALRNETWVTSVQAYHWSGRNDVNARRSAAQDLAIVLTDLSTRDPKTPIALIAHSHGGNVAPQAVARANLPPESVHVVALATPFLHISTERMDHAASLMLLCAVSSIMVPALWQAFGLWLPVWLHPPRSVQLLVATAASLTLAALVGSIVLWKSLGVRKWTESIATQPPPNVRLLSVRFSEDEAAKTLTGADSALLLLSRLWHGAAALSHRLAAAADVLTRAVELPRPRYFMVTISAAVILGSIGFLGAEPILGYAPATDTRWTMAAVFVFAVPLLSASLALSGFLALFAAMPVILALYWALGAPFGLRLALAAPLVALSVSDTPVGMIASAYVAPSSTELDGKLLSQHQRPYQDDAIIQVIVEWLRSGASPATNAYGAP